MTRPYATRPGGADAVAEDVTSLPHPLEVETVDAAPEAYTDAQQRTAATRAAVAAGLAPFVRWRVCEIGPGSRRQIDVGVAGGGTR